MYFIVSLIIAFIYTSLKYKEYRLLTKNAYIKLFKKNIKYINKYIYLHFKTAADIENLDLEYQKIIRIQEDIGNLYGDNLLSIKLKFQVNKLITNLTSDNLSIRLYNYNKFINRIKAFIP